MIFKLIMIRTNNYCVHLLINPPSIKCSISNFLLLPTRMTNEQWMKLLIIELLPTQCPNKHRTELANRYLLYIVQLSS